MACQLPAKGVTRIASPLTVCGCGRVFSNNTRNGALREGHAQDVLTMECAISLGGIRGAQKARLEGLPVCNGL